METLCFIQSWCFIGLTLEFFAVFHISVHVDDLVHPQPRADGELETFATTDKLPALLLSLESRTRGYDTDEEAMGEDPLCEAFETIDGYLSAVRGFIARLDIHGIREEERRFNSSESLLCDVIHLSIILLGQALDEGASLLNSYGGHWGNSIWLRERMLSAGWCRSETYSLLNQHEADPATLFYLGHMNRHSLQRSEEHKFCGDDFRCNRENLDHSSYKTKHIAACVKPHECQDVNPDSCYNTVISEVVFKEEIPLITVCEHAETKQWDIRIQSAQTRLGE
jgi:hypothetical protein